MRTFCLVAVLCLFGCSQTNRPTSADTPADEPVIRPEAQDRPSITLDDLIDGHPMGYHHPLVCGPGGDFPDGQEMDFQGRQSGTFVHAVFPKGVEPPKTLDGTFVLHGYYQGIQKWDRYTLLRPPDDYQCFVVSSWEHKP